MGMLFPLSHALANTPRCALKRSRRIGIHNGLMSAVAFIRSVPSAMGGTSGRRAACAMASACLFILLCGERVGWCNAHVQYTVVLGEDGTHQLTGGGLDSDTL